MHTVRTLAPWQLDQYRDHLKRLNPEDRRLRFGHALGDAGIDRFVDGLDPAADRVLVCYDAQLRVVGAVHVSRLTAGEVELAFSVEAAHRGQGVGTALCRRALLWARNRGLRRAMVFCLAENGAMRRLALRCGMALALDSGECDGRLALRPATPMTLFSELTGEALGLYAAAAQIRREALVPLRPLRPAA